MCTKVRQPRPVLRGSPGWKTSREVEFLLGFKETQVIAAEQPALFFIYIYYTEMLQGRQSEVHRGLVGC